MTIKDTIFIVGHKGDKTGMCRGVGDKIKFDRLNNHLTHNQSLPATTKDTIRTKTSLKVPTEFIFLVDCQNALT